MGGGAGTYRDALVPAPLDGSMLGLEPASVSDLIPRTVVGGGAGTCGRLTDAGFLLLFAI